MGSREKSSRHDLETAIANHRVPNGEQRHSAKLATPDHVHRRSFLTAMVATVLTAVLGRQIDQSAQVTPTKFGYGGVALTENSESETTDLGDQTPQTVQEYGTFGYGGITEESE